MKTQKTEIVDMGRLYRITGSPNILHDQNSMVEIWVAENTTHRGYWKLLKYGNRRLNIADQARRLLNK